MQKQIVVLTTGGTIASRWQGSGYAADTPGRELVARAPLPPGVAVTVTELFNVNSARLTVAHQLTLLHAVHRELARPEVAGIVVTHGTDTLEETAFLLDLHHADSRPVVITGAQLPADSEQADGPGNLKDAVVAAATLDGVGTVVVFDRTVHAARGTVKTHTLRLDTFADPSGRPIGEVGDVRAVVRHPSPRPAALPLPPMPRTRLRVDMVMHHTDADPLLLRAAADAGAEGIVLVATGAGNATPHFVEAVAELTGRGVPVALTTRVAAGPVVEIYTCGGAVDLVAAGALPTGTLRAGQARIAVLAALLATPDPAGRRAVLRRVLAASPDAPAVGAHHGPAPAC
ncbi:asparaginase [Kitasatospora sp. NPDC057015]|uniref:asparaginase n=1 Tax=Kitasatospora sp. NPDC057015 TaxID=3346001 RepID=UPI003627DB45